MIAQIRQVTNNRSWINAEDIVAQIQQFCVDINWRKTIYRSLFTSGDQMTRIATSYFVQSDTNSEPIFELPQACEVEKYEEIAAELQPRSLQTQVYLNLNASALTEVRASPTQLNFSTTNLAKCDPDSLSQLDLDSFLLCTIIQTRRALDAEKSYFETYTDRPYDKPSVMPIANMMEVLCTEDQIEWWSAVFKVLKNQSGENLPQIRAIIQNGIEAVRGEGPPKVDSIVLLRLAKTLSQRAQTTLKPEEKRMLETRAEHLFRTSLRRQKHNTGLGKLILMSKTPEID